MLACVYSLFEPHHAAPTHSPTWRRRERCGCRAVFTNCSGMYSRTYCCAEAKGCSITHASKAVTMQTKQSPERHLVEWRAGLGGCGKLAMICHSVHAQAFAQDGPLPLPLNLVRNKSTTSSTTQARSGRQHRSLTSLRHPLKSENFKHPGAILTFHKPASTSQRHSGQTA